MSPDLDDHANNFGDAHENAKAWTRAKDTARKNLLEKFSEEAATLPTTQVRQRVEADDEEAALRIAQRKWQRYTVSEITDGLDGNFDLVLEENPDLKPFTYISKEGKVYSTSVVDGSPILDDEGMQEEDPELWEAITETVTEKRLKPLDTLTPEQQQAIQPYITMPRPIVRMNSPRQAKEEELNENDNRS